MTIDNSTTLENKGDFKNQNPKKHQEINIK